MDGTQGTERMKHFPTIVGALLAAAILMGIVAIKVSVWHECRAGHSWFYCLHLMGN